MTDSIVSADGIHSEQVRRLDSAPSLRSLETVFGAGDREAPAARPDKERPVETAAGALHPQNNEYTVKLPIHLRGQRLGSLVLRRGSSIGPWQDDEKDLLQQTLGQLALALENARLLEEVQRRASYEETINRIIGKVQSSLNLDNVMRSAVQEIGRALNASKVQIRINPESTGDSIESPPNPTGAPPEPAAFPDLQAISTVISGAAAAADILQRTPEEAPSVRTRGARRTRVRPADRRSPTEAAADAARDASEASHSAPPEYPGHE